MDIGIYLAVSIWLIYLVVADLRRGEVTNWVTVPPLLGVVAWRVIRGEWVIGVVLVLVLIVAEWPWSAWPLGMAGAALCLPWVIAQDLESVTTVWFVALGLWLIGALGGADVKVVMTMMALFPDAHLGWLLLLVWLGIGLLRLMRRYGRAVPAVLASTLENLARFRPPDGERNPAMPVIALAWLAYVLLSLVERR